MLFMYEELDEKISQICLKLLPLLPLVFAWKLDFVDSPQFCPIFEQLFHFIPIVDHPTKP